MASQTDCELNDLTSLYHAFESKMSVIPPPQDASLKNLVTFDSSKSAPIHRWYPFKEGYSNKLLSTLEAREIIPAKSARSLLDPFCGVATTLLSCQVPGENGNVQRAVGVEWNPAIHFVAKSKLNWYRYEEGAIKRLLERLSLPRRGRRRTFPIPALSTFNAAHKNGKRAFEPGALQDLVFYREWIRENCESQLESDFFMLAWTSVIEQASNTRKDGRALRLIEASRTPSVKQLLIERCELMLEDLSLLRGKQRSESTAEVLLGDGRCLPFKDGSFTALCYSPPYLNNIDYSEVYKLELWLRGDVTNNQQFHSLRGGTFRSHPSIKFRPTSICDQLRGPVWIRRLKDALIAALPTDKYRRMRQALFSGYIDDMLIALKEQARVSVPGAPIVCVVGNSLHGGKDNPSVPVCTDLLICAAARAVGLTIDHLQIARQLPRRDNRNGWLRESIIVMRTRAKPMP